VGGERGGTGWESGWAGWRGEEGDLSPLSTLTLTIKQHQDGSSARLMARLNRAAWTYLPGGRGLSTGSAGQRRLSNPRPVGACLSAYKDTPLLPLQPSLRAPLHHLLLPRQTFSSLPHFTPSAPFSSSSVLCLTPIHLPGYLPFAVGAPRTFFL
jgi:hypothetical protein